MPLFGRVGQAGGGVDGLLQMLGGLGDGFVVGQAGIDAKGGRWCTDAQLTELSVADMS